MRRSWQVATLALAAGLSGVLILMAAAPAADKAAPPAGPAAAPAPSGPSLAAESAGGESFRFCVMGDVRANVALFDEQVLAAVAKQYGSLGVFGISVGDDELAAEVRARIDARFGPETIWYHGMGNHEAGVPACMQWLRDDYNTGHGGRAAFKTHTNQDGPAGSVETTYSWDYGDVHFVMLNEYWNDAAAPGSDAATSGDAVPALVAWLDRDLQRNKRPVVMVVGHEPAYPQGPRHTDDSLNANVEQRDAFWKVLEKHGVQAYFCGHTHYYSRYRPDGGQVWQIDVGNAGNQPDVKKDGTLTVAPDKREGLTFVNVVVTPAEIRYETWRNQGGKTFSRADSWTQPVKTKAPATAAGR